MNNLLYKLNPIAKIIIVILIITPASFSYDLYFITILIFFLLISIKLFAGIEVFQLLKRLNLFIFSSFCLVIFFMINRGLNQVGEYKFFIFAWNLSDISLSVAIGLRMVLFALTSLIFVETTDAVDLVKSIIHQLKVPYMYGYAFLAAYRFVPTFNQELTRIRYAHEARGISSGNGLFANIINIPKYIIPLLLTAIRKGEKVSIAMEARAFGAHKERTYYKIPAWTKKDNFAIFTVLVFLVGVISILINFNLFSFAKSFSI